MNVLYQKAHLRKVNLLLILKNVRLFITYDFFNKYKNHVFLRKSIEFTDDCASKDEFYF